MPGLNVTSAIQLKMFKFVNKLPFSATICAGPVYGLLRNNFPLCIPAVNVTEVFFLRTVCLTETNEESG